MCSSDLINGKGNGNGKRTPPPNKKFQASALSSNTTNTNHASNSSSHPATAAAATPTIANLQADSNFPLTKSKSHESQLANRVESTSETNLVRSVQIPFTYKAARGLGVSYFWSLSSVLCTCTRNSRALQAQAILCLRCCTSCEFSYYSLIF